jgi:DNA polymerase-3 subunit gamma/tau
VNNNLYRKYRPKDFDEILGQPHVVKYFKNALNKQEVSHAYIFSGPRGTGKTTTARILAKVLNCKDPQGYNPCNKCENCVSINNNSFLDVIEMDAASNRGIDEIRNIRDSSNYRPVYGKYKVYIIDEFHMLTREAFNALLKTLEEPPSHVIFILATTNLEKVPDTIISRAQIINFKNLGQSEIVEGLKNIASSEGIEYELDALEIIAKRAKGGMRDAISMLEQVEKFGEMKITHQDTLDILGLFDENFIVQFIENVYNSKIDEFLAQSEDLFNLGKDPEILLEQSIEYIFDSLINEKRSNLIHLMGTFNDILKDLKYSENKRLIFDVEILDFMHKNSTTSSTISYDKETTPKRKQVATESVPKETQHPIMKKILDYFSDPHEKKSNMAIYFALLFSNPEIENNKIHFKFSSNQKLEYEILKKYVDELKVNIFLLIDGSYEITFSLEGGEVESLTQQKEKANLREKKLF